ncbi:MAG TPA: hypothetical protein VIA18_08200 [Polyangia bacterium]|nr:hypothetical protein [Polyangia bacterium]
MNVRICLVSVFTLAFGLGSLANAQTQPMPTDSPPGAKAPGSAPVTPPAPVAPPAPVYTAVPPAPVAPTVAPAQPRLALEFTTLRIMLAKGIITQAEFDSAMRDTVETTGDAGGDAPTLMLGKWSTTLYGFVEADNIYDTTESFNDQASSSAVQKGTGYAGNHGRFTMGIRNSRIGFRMRAPEYHGVRASAMLEMDFLGNQAQVGYAQAYQISESAYFTNPTFRVRHMNLKIETPIVDILFGQYWQLFGWQSVYHPNSVEIQGLPGQIYSRTPQIRVSKTVKTPDVTFEAAVAMMRAPQRDSWSPEGQGGLRLAYNKWTAVTTAGAAGTSIQPLSVAFTADVRKFNLPNFAAKPDHAVGKTGWGIAADGFFPLIKGTKTHKSNSLVLQGEYALGQGIADLYSSLNGGVANAALPNTAMAATPPTYTIDADPSLVLFSADGAAHLIQWQSVLVGVQYYLPGLDGRMWVSSNYTRSSSDNAYKYAASAATGGRKHEDFADANLFADILPSVRLGLEYAYFRDTYSDTAVGSTFAVHHRVQLSAFYLF